MQCSNSSVIAPEGPILALSEPLICGVRDQAKTTPQNTPKSQSQRACRSLLRRKTHLQLPSSPSWARRQQRQDTAGLHPTPPDHFRATLPCRDGLQQPGSDQEGAVAQSKQPARPGAEGASLALTPAQGPVLPTGPMGFLGRWVLLRAFKPQNKQWQKLVKSQALSPPLQTHIPGPTAGSTEEHELAVPWGR